MFEEPLNSTKYGPFGPAAVQALVGTFYQNVKGDFRDWDLTIQFFIAKFPGGQRVPTDDALLEYLQPIYSTERELKDGSILKMWGPVTSGFLSGRNVSTVSTTDMEHVGSYELKKAGSFLGRAPTRNYHLRIDDQLVFGIRLKHANERKLSPQHLADAEALVAAIIGSIRID